MIREHRQTKVSWDRRVAPITDGNAISTGQIAAPAISIMRKSTCACGGGCPACRPKSGDLKISQPTDAAEIEADRIADSVMRMPAAEFHSTRDHLHSPGSGVIHRKCNTCADEDDQEEIVKRKAVSTGDASPAPSAGSPARNAVSSGGQPLDPETRSFFEPRLGYDLSGVRIHTDSMAASSARAIDARAYTLGRDIVFGSGEYSPRSEAGRHLIAHELAHVTQQNGSQPTEIRRMTIGSGTPPGGFASYNPRVVPGDELERVQEAIAVIQEIVDNPDTYSDCLAAFVERCPGNSPTAFADTFNNAVLWRGDSPGANARGEVSGNNILYTRGGYDQGANGLAKTLVHEMGHNCGIPGGDEHYFAAIVGSYCVGPENYIGVRFGINPITEVLGLALVYRRLFDIAHGGQLQLSLGADLDIIGLAAGIVDASTTGDIGTFSEFEFGSLNVGLRGRFNPWGGEGFGGITLGAETGIDVGRFRIARETGEDEFEYGPGVILQSTLGAEFYIPINPSIMQVAPEFGYRLIRPLNPEAENIHEIVFGLGGMF